MIDNLRCPQCLSKLNSDTSILICVSCQSVYPVLFGVPLLSPNVEVGKKPTRPSSAFVNEMTRFLGANDARTRNDVHDCFGLDLKFSDPVLQTEAEQFLNRLSSSGVELPVPFELSDSRENEPMARPLKANLEDASAIRLGWIVAPDCVRPGQLFSVSVVVLNGSKDIVSSDQTPMLRLAYWWERGGKKLKRRWWERLGRKIEGRRTPFLIDLGPGRQISMPIHVQAPNAPGVYTLQVMPIIEGVGWVVSSAITAPVSVEDGHGDPLSVDWMPDVSAKGVEQDHSRALELCREWVNELIPSPVPKILELGGNFNPMVKYLPGERFNVDIDAFSLMTYNIRESRRADISVQNVVSNGTMLPFENKSVDVIIMFATFHHFPDPISLLCHLKSKLKDDGIICLMCEPIGHVFRETGAHEFITELTRGVYEQSFMPWEYREMLSAAGLVVVKSALDIGSLKLAARKAV